MEVIISLDEIIFQLHIYDGDLYKQIILPVICGWAIVNDESLLNFYNY